jgi:hypothetical protein
MIFEGNLTGSLKGMQYAAKLFGMQCDVEIKKVIKTRSSLQNRALHLYWKLLADTLNNEGHTYSSRNGKELKFTAFKIESDWRELMLEMYGLESTKDLTSEMLNSIYDCLNLYYSENYGIFQDFPNWQSYMNELDKRNFNY